MTIAALYVQTGGAYYGLPGVDPWDEARDARTYPGPHPVVAHPPCSRWCRLAGLVEARWGHKRGDDGGTFAAALDSVRRWGGVLEHPAYSDAWGAYGLNRPPAAGGWVVADWDGGWTCHVEQGRYGHRAKKATWLYAHGVEMPSLRWGACEGDGWVPVSRARIGPGRSKSADALGGKGGSGASHTPDAFRDELLGMARTWRRGVGVVGTVGASIEIQSKRERNATPEEFRAALLDMAHSVPRGTEGER